MIFEFSRQEILEEAKELTAAKYFDQAGEKPETSFFEMRGFLHLEAITGLLYFFI